MLKFLVDTSDLDTLFLSSISSLFFQLD